MCNHFLLFSLYVYCNFQKISYLFYECFFCFFGGGFKKGYYENPFKIPVFKLKEGSISLGQNSHSCYNFYTHSK